MNPCCGWYRIITVDVGADVPIDSLLDCACDTSLILVRLNLQSYRRSELDQPALHRITSIIEWGIGRGQALIIRALYDTEGHGMVNEPNSVEMVERHMKQLGRTLLPYAAHILVCQGLLIGSWGEMHSSRFLQQKHLQRLSRAFRNATENQICFSVRQPVQWRQINDDSANPLMGIYNDALFGSTTDLGTYGSQPAEVAGDQGQWLPEEERAFIAKTASTVPFGGEVLSCEEALSPTEVVRQLALLQTTYLNCEWDAQLLEQWRQTAFLPEVGWNSLYDYIGAHLGYHLVMTDIEVKRQSLRHFFRLRIKIENKGFATVWGDAQVELVLQPWDNGEPVVLELSGCPTLHGLRPKGSVEIEARVPFLPGNVYLRILHSIERKMVHLYNQGDEDPAYGLLIGKITCSEKS